MAKLLRTALFIALIFTAGSAFAGTYYIAANGSDSNSGTSKTSPWMHAPGMPNCTGNCGAHKASPGDQFIFRGGDTWHFGNSSATPYTGGTWDIFNAFIYSYSNNVTNCIFEAAQTGCLYFGVDLTWFSGGSWTRPIMTGDNSTSTTLVASCAHQIAGTPSPLSNNNMISTASGVILDNFELTGLCSSDSTVTSGVQDTYIAYPGTSSGTGTDAFYLNLYIHGWTATTTAGQGGNNQPGTIIGGSPNGLQAFDHIVVDGQDSNPGSFAWATFPGFDHFRDSIVRYTNQGVGQACHDIHDNIFEHFYNHNSGAGSHTNVLECNDDANPSTANVFYNNILRHDDSSYTGSGQVHWWFCPESAPEYWFNNMQYDVALTNNWDYAGPPIYGCTNTGGQFMFNNTLIDIQQPCNVSNVGHGGQYLTVLNEHLINTPFDTNTGTACTGRSSATNIAMSDATATSQGYTTGSSGTAGTRNTCANDSTTPCAPTSGTNSTVGAGANHQAYCTALAAFTSEPAIGTDAANACKFGTTDGCAYNATTHAMICPAQTPAARPASNAWDIGASQFLLSSQVPLPPANLQITLQ